MSHDPYHAIFFGSGILYFLIGFYFAYKNYNRTDHEGFWFFSMLFSLAMSGVMIAGTLWSTEIVTEQNAIPFHESLFLIASIFLLTATYTLNKKQHKVKVF
jgi:hypothetical protein